ncbi:MULTISPECIES: multiprotein-bridging factor 1 family protein [Metabacillus]|jgi:transcriptional regulator with XRE-family HTH domain|uniref:Helix-turn-helix domain-containing protein n=1 Tax=Metabacillus rhizolycopersici TaxID=2875709 RepID=A0ABS7UXM1_9BACI|nr:MULTISPECIES: helix-turn-helix transcriptional regulator [Metabacillus]MBZ5753068.1 helix-turn-helix domain-containing protein [Metabacillus rhizolycopersici]MCM3654481.1 helix-turn-helix domain-containing protein [Metabacillus litoralis]
MLNEPCLGYGLKIQEMRERLGLTRSELGLLTKTDENVIIKLELSKIHPSDYFIETIATAFNVNPFELKKSIWCNQELDQCRAELL